MVSNKFKTVIVLVAIMATSGFLVPKAYLKYMNNRDFRPPFEKRLLKNIQLMDDVKGVISLTEFDNSIWFAYSTTSKAEKRNILVHKKIKALRERFPKQQFKTCIFLVDATPEDKSLLRSYREEEAQWLTEDDHIIAANVAILQKYMKNEFRFSQLPYLKEGEWIYDKDLIIIDNKQHLRGHLDFEKAQKVDQESAQSGNPMMQESRMNDLLVNSITYLLENPEEEDPALKGEK